MDSSIRVADLGASRGAGWIAGSWTFFRAAPMAWMGLCGGWLMVIFALLLMGVVGVVIMNFVQPVFFASFAIAAYRQAAGERLAMADLFSGFRRNLRPLVNIGAIMMIVEFAVAMLMTALGLPTVKVGDDLDLAEYADALGGKEWILFTGLVLMALTKAILWFTPPLIAFHGMDTLQAIRWSAYAAISNAGALATYFLLLSVMIVLGMAPWLLGLIVVIPLGVISTYVSYHEVFESAPAKPE